MSNENIGMLGIDSGIYELLIRIYLLIYSIFYLIKVINTQDDNKEEKRNNKFRIIKLVIIAIFIRFLLIEGEVTFIDTILELFNWLIKQISLKMIHIITPILQILLIITKKKNLYFIPLLFNLFYADIVSNIMIAIIKNS